MNRTHKGALGSGCYTWYLLQGVLMISVLHYAECTAGWNLTFSPTQLHQVPIDTSRNVTVNATSHSTAPSSSEKQLRLTLLNSDPRVVRLNTGNNASISLQGACSPSECLLQGSFSMHGLIVGFSNLSIVSLHNVQSNTQVPVDSDDVYMVSVIAEESHLTSIFGVLLLVIICLVNLSFGCAFDLDIAREVFKRPVAPVVGFVCQYGLMPAFSYLYGYLFKLSMPQRLGLLTIGCSPGGGSSNILTLLLDGDITLSLCMTFISNVAALAMMPLWLLTLGAYISGSTVTIPFVDLAVSLCTLIVPLLIGVILNRYLPKVSRGIVRVLQPIAVLILIALVVLGVVTKPHLLPLITASWRPLVAAMCVPPSALTCSLMLSLITRQPRRRVLTIGIETCIQNTSIAMVLLLNTLPQPLADMASIMPVLVAVCTQAPLLVVVVIKKLADRLCCSSSSGKYDVSTIGAATEKENNKKSAPQDPVHMVVNRSYHGDFGEKISTADVSGSDIAGMY